MCKPEISREIHLEFSEQESTGSCTFFAVDLSFNPWTKSKNCTIKGMSRSRDRWYQFSKKQLLYIEKSRCRMGLKYCTIPSYYWTDSAFVKHILLHIFVADRSAISPPDPMNHVKIFKGWPLQDAAPKLVQLWYKSFQPGRFLPGGNEEANCVE